MHRAIAKLFAAGGSQAVRLPAEFRFEGRTEVYVRRDEFTGDVILSTHPPTDWATFMRQRARIGAVVPDDFPERAEREARQERRDPFENWTE